MDPIWDLPEISSHPTTRHDTTDLFDLLGAPPSLTDHHADANDHGDDPHDLPPPPRALVPPQPEPPLVHQQPHHQPEAWHTFLDDNCPFKRRVKVTRKRSNPNCTNNYSNNNITNDESPHKRVRTLSFPPEFPTPHQMVPRRARVALAPVPTAPVEQRPDLFMDPLSASDGDQVDAQVEVDVGAETEVESLCEVGATATLCGGGGDGSVEVPSVALAPVAPAPETDGYLTPKLVARLTAVLLPVSEVSTESISSSGRSSGGQLLLRDPVVLPCVSAAVAAVSAAATAYSASLRTART